MDTAGGANRRPLGRQRVLVVDGDEDLRDVLRLILEEEGYDVRTLATGTEALALLQGDTGETGSWVILLDHRLRGLDGLGILHALHAERAAGRIAAVYMSAGGAETERVQSQLAALGVPYLRKPFDLDDMLDMVHLAATYLAQRQVERPRDMSGPRPRDDVSPDISPDVSPDVSPLDGARRCQVCHAPHHTAHDTLALRSVPHTVAGTLLQP